MNIKFTNFLLLSILLTPSFAMACSCVDIKTFCETITDRDGIINSDLIVLAKKTKHHDDGMEIRILKVFHGKEESQDLFIPKGTGADCLINTDLFHLGNRYIFALDQRDNQGAGLKRVLLWECGVNYLEIKGSNVKGSIAPGKKKIPLAKFDLFNLCPYYLFFKIYPNPAQQFINIEIDTDEKTSGYFRIFDVAGRLVEEHAFEVEGGARVIHNIQNLSNGLYLVELNVLGRKRVTKIVVRNS